MMTLAVLAACGTQGDFLRLPMPAGAAGFAIDHSEGALIVLRPAQPLTYSDGLTAKRAAQAYCAGQGAVLNPAAFGTFQTDAWRFAGGCA